MLIIKGCVSNLGQKCECRIVLMLLFTVNGAFDFGLKYYPSRSNSEIVANCFRPLELFDFFPTPSALGNSTSALGNIARGTTDPEIDSVT